MDTYTVRAATVPRLVRCYKLLGYMAATANTAGDGCYLILWLFVCSKEKEGHWHFDIRILAVAVELEI